MKKRKKKNGDSMKIRKKKIKKLKKGKKWRIKKNKLRRKRLEIEKPNKNEKPIKC